MNGGSFATARLENGGPTRTGRPRLPAATVSPGNP